MNDHPPIREMDNPDVCRILGKALAALDDVPSPKVPNRPRYNFNIGLALDPNGAARPKASPR